jgi:hypothetical protein
MFRSELERCVLRVISAVQRPDRDSGRTRRIAVAGVHTVPERGQLPALYIAGHQSRPSEPGGPDTHTIGAGAARPATRRAVRHRAEGAAG